MNIKHKKYTATIFAILDAALYAINNPISKMLLKNVDATKMAGFLYLGAGFENNCTKMISNKSSEEIVVIKGIFSGLGSVIIALIIGENIPSTKYILAVLLLGFVAYGLSINFYIMAQKDLGAAKTSAYYSIAPFLGVAFSMILLGERPRWQFYVALGIIVISTFIMIKDTDEVMDSVK